MSNRGRIKTTTAFAARIAHKRAEAAAACSWATYAVKKSGGLYAQPHRVYRTKAEAEAEANRMMGLNPTSRYVAAEVAR